MPVYCLRHVPSDRICDVEGDVCYVTFATLAAGRDHIAVALAEYAANYEVVALPANLRAAPLTLPLQPTDDDLRHLESAHSKRYTRHLLDPADPIRARIIMERAVVRRALTDIIAAGNWVRVYYGADEGYGCARTDNVAVAMDALQACDEEMVFVFCNSSDRRTIGFLSLVYGNSGWEVIANNNVSLEPLLAGASQFANELADAEAHAA